MKIRKILPLMLLAIGSLFLLSSCDAMLDAIFPENTINVYVTAAIATYCTEIAPGVYVLSSGTDSVSVSVLGPKDVTGTAIYAGNDSYYMYWSVSVPKLPNGAYEVSITYFHPVGPFHGAYQLNQLVSLPAGSSHRVNLSFPF